MRLGDLRGSFHPCFPHFAPEWLNLKAVSIYSNTFILKNQSSGEFSCPPLCWWLEGLWGHHCVLGLLTPTSGTTLRKCTTMQRNKNKRPCGKIYQVKSVWESAGGSTWSSLALTSKPDPVPAVDVADTVPWLFPLGQTMPLAKNGWHEGHRLLHASCPCWWRWAFLHSPIHCP